MKKSSVHSKLFKIACTNVPPDLLLKQPAKQYFSQFGKIIRLLLRPKSKTCVIEYDSEWSVQLALTNGGEYNGNHFTITRDTKHSPKKRQAKKEDDPDWTLDPEVQSELEAMGGFMIKKKYNLRPELMVVDAVDVPKAKESVKAVKSASKWRVGSPKTNQSSAAASSEKMELLKIIKQSAVTAEEKYKILEARDKLIRICTRKHTDLSKAAHTVGTCPDMCPEKERLMRETQHQVAVYEQEVGCKDMNPSLAVKQYSRSSADQEVPLPHELRPVHVLQMTMTYLMTRIMNLCDSPDVNFAEWYHFLWDRTRGIRKDITQQELCCQGSVQLVEQCARFHIHCSARLVAEDPSVFDQKINTENLTKCLQTLKYMYHDLELKHVRCENEAEFRAYIILLNLNDGNFMWEVQQLKSEIQKSDEVKFALQVYSALDKNNYVRFFNLVKSTTYLNACILLRYFIQVRLNALKTILKCFSPRSPHNSYPLDELTGILAFENADSTVDFLKYHGLQLNEEETHVVLERRLFGLPKFPYALDRAIGVIESKRVCSVGEVVCGKYSTLVDFEGHVPQDSFTADGFLACNLDEFGGTKDLPTEIEVPEPKTEEPTKPFSFAAAGDSIFGGPATTFQSPGSIFGSSIFQNLPESEFSKSPDNSSDLWKRPELDSDSWPFKPSEAASEQTETVFGADTLDSASSSVFVPDESPVCAPRKSPISIFTIPSNEEAQLQEMRREEEARRENEIEAAKELQRQLEKAEKLRKKKAEKEERLKLEREQRQRDLEREKQRKLAEKKKKQEELRLQREKIRHEQQIKRDVSHIMNQLLTKVELTHRENRVKTLQQKLRLRKLKLVFTKWRETARIINRKRKAMDLTPVYFPSRTPKEEADELRTRSQDLTLQLVKRYKHGKPNPVAAFQEQPAPKIEVHELVHKTLLTSRHALGVGFCSELFWKVVVSVQAGIACERSMRSVDEILDECLRWTRSDGAKRLVQQKKLPSQRITYCIERQSPADPTRDAHALVFVIERLNDTACRKIRDEAVQCAGNVPVPVAVVTQNVESAEKLDECVDEGIVSSYKVQRDAFCGPSVSEMLATSLVFLAAHVEQEPPLEADYLRGFLHKYWATEIWRRVSSLSKWNENYRTCLKVPDIVISLCNDNLEKLKLLVVNERRFGFPDFPHEFKPHLLSPQPDFLPCDYKYLPERWRNTAYNTRLADVLDEFRLPKYTGAWPPKDKEELEGDVYDYCIKCFKVPEKAYYRIMSVVLKNLEESFEKIVDVLWTEVVETITLIKVQEGEYELKGKFAKGNNFKEMFVVYDTNDLTTYMETTWYYVNYPLIEERIKEMRYKTEEESDVEDEKEESFEIGFDLDEMLEKITKDIVDKSEGDLKRKQEVSELEWLMKDLGESIDIQKRISERMEQTLKTVVKP